MRILLYFVISISLFSCSKYNSKEYLSKENELITQLIPQMTDLEDMIEMNQDYYSVVAPSLYIYNELIPTTLACQLGPYIVKKVDDEWVYIDSFYYDWDKESIEFKLFKPLINGKLPQRKLELNTTYKGVNAKLVNKHFYNLYSRKKDDSVFGFLVISRAIIKNDKAYLSYSFSCGDQCFWNDNLEAELIDGKWVISNCFSGGIA